MSKERTDGLEVAREAVACFPRFAKLLGVDIQDIYKGVEHVMVHTGPFAWDDFVLLEENIQRLAGTDEKLLELGQYVLEPKGSGGMTQAVGFFVKPKYIILASVRLMKRLYSNLDIRSFEDLDEGIRINIRIPNSFAPCRTLFVVTAGALAALPMQIGLGPSQVDWETEGGRQVVYTIRPPPPARTLWSRLKATFQIIRSTQVAAFQIHQGELELAARERVFVSALRERSRALDEREKNLEAERLKFTARKQFTEMLNREIRSSLNRLLHTIWTPHSRFTEGDDSELLREMTESAIAVCRALEPALTFSRLSEGGVQWQPSAHRISDLRDAMSFSMSRPDRRFLGTRIVDVKMSPSCLGWWAIDLMQLECLGRELIMNACVRTPVDQQIECCLEVGGGMLHIEVRDRGPSVSEQELLESSLKNIDGSALGMAIVKMIVRGIGGRVRFEDHVEGGMLTRVEVPISPVAAPTFEGDGRRVLIVDDDRVHQRIAQRLLQTLSCDVVLVDDGQQALECVEQQAFDLILMDCEMPGIDGWAATQELRARGYTLPIVAITASISEMNRFRCFEVGMNDFLAKPLIPELIALVINKWLGAPSVLNP